ncbi:sushi, von Willebrand factor type A, EGF and pentraxin domain-containing protein 1-like isoform X2 [Mugil cephalus]|uniref:sushi, von Willebrand factor type A, EGF and pentraxin domain-containing protein 1-like isoform X2 n=1 Tax=Mugil cephalus TaxID=48193 RepID=UPI001FB801DD|nr:sushi, von Willebrand factor type A, EGF and pentraxin domain-containing protein 1-like isoform X2 [Mugil cephalus]
MGISAFLLLSSIGLAIPIQAQDCSRPLGNPNTRLSDANILLQTFPDGTQVSFVCEVGYLRAGGSPQITCTAGVWSTLMLKCERKNCGALGEVSNGDVDYPEGTLFGDKAVISCNDGYMLVGRNEITCGDRGWDSRLPVCQEMTCESPPVVTDATFSPDKETYGNRESVKYTCKSGYTLNGTAHLFCSDGGIFTPDPPTCVRVQCYEPSVANAEWVRGSRPPYGYLSAVTYQCRPGYKMNGESTLTCGINSQWLPGIPTCERKNCGALGNVSNGDVDYPQGTLFGDKAVISCNDGFKLVGKKEITCGDLGWDSMLPVCQEVTCDSPPVVTDATFSPNKETYGNRESVKYTCKNGYTLNGTPQLFCSNDGIFTPDPPTCVRKNCGSLGNVSNGDVDYPEGTLFGDKAVISCNDGFMLVGKKEITCGDKGWDSNLPTCEVVTCKSPPVVTDATFSPNKETYGYRESVKYTCKSGYTLNGTAHLFCLDGRFTPDPPTCVRVQCFEPNVANADWAGGSRPPYGHLSTVTYQCNPGYKMNGESTLTCGMNSQWLPRIPTCERVQCYEPSVANAEWAGGSRAPYGHLSTVTYQCKPGYKMNGEPTLTCGINSQWLPSIPTCEKVLTTTTASTTTTTSNTPHSSKKPTASTPAATTTANTPVTPKTPTNTPVTPKTPTNTPVTPKTPTNTPVTPKTPTNTPVTPKTPTGPVTPTPPTGRGITHIVVPIVVVLVILGVIIATFIVMKKKRKGSRRGKTDKKSTNAEEDVALSVRRQILKHTHLCQMKRDRRFYQLLLLMFTLACSYPLFLFSASKEGLLAALN